MLRSLRISLVSGLVLGIASSIATAGAVRSEGFTFAELNRGPASHTTADRDAVLLAGCGHGHGHGHGNKYYRGHYRGPVGYGVGYGPPVYYGGYGPYRGYQAGYRGYPGYYHYNQNFYRGGYAPYGVGYRSGVGLYIGF